MKKMKKIRKKKFLQRESASSLRWRLLIITLTKNPKKDPRVKQDLVDSHRWQQRDQ